MQFQTLVEAAERVRATRSRLQKLEALVPLLRAAAADDSLALAVAYLAGEVPQGKLGVGPAALRSLATPEPSAADGAELALAAVDAALQRVRDATGSGSKGRKQAELTALLAAATESGQDFLLRLVGGELRQGAVAGLMREAIARAFEVDVAAVHRAAMLTGRLDRVAELARAGSARLAAVRLELFRPLEPMLAQTAVDVADALARLAGPVALEHKLDGARIQVHKAGDRVRVFTRHLREVTGAVPEVVQLARELPADRLVLDGEVLALADDGRPRPFQVTMRRFGRRLDVAAMRATLPLTPFFFDCLHRDGDDVFDRELTARRVALVAVVPAGNLVPQVLVSAADAEAAERFYDAALAAGHEGVLAKAEATRYEAGRRGSGWLKIKPAHTLDLVVLAAEWGSGRREGTLSNLWLGARADAEADAETGFVMLGKTFKGLTDELLAWQTRELLARETCRDGHVVHVRPELVVEIALDGVQTSSQYPGGVALRFARVRGYREDKNPAQADTLATVRALGAT